MVLNSFDCQLAQNRVCFVHFDNHYVIEKALADS